MNRVDVFGAAFLDSCSPNNKEAIAFFTELACASDGAPIFYLMDSLEHGSSPSIIQLLIIVFIQNVNHSSQFYSQNLHLLKEPAEYFIWNLEHNDLLANTSVAALEKITLLLQDTEEFSHILRFLTENITANENYGYALSCIIRCVKVDQDTTAFLVESLQPLFSLDEGEENSKLKTYVAEIFTCIIEEIVSISSFESILEFTDYLLHCDNIQRYKILVFACLTAIPKETDDQLEQLEPYFKCVLDIIIEDILSCEELMDVCESITFIDTLRSMGISYEGDDHMDLLVESFYKFYPESIESDDFYLFEIICRAIIYCVDEYMLENVEDFISENYNNEGAKERGLSLLFIQSLLNFSESCTIIEESSEIIFSLINIEDAEDIENVEDEFILAHIIQLHLSSELKVGCDSILYPIAINIIPVCSMALLNDVLSFIKRIAKDSETDIHTVIQDLMQTISSQISTTKLAIIIGAINSIPKEQFPHISLQDIGVLMDSYFASEDNITHINIMSLISIVIDYSIIVGESASVLFDLIITGFEKDPSNTKCFDALLLLISRENSFADHTMDFFLYVLNDPSVNSNTKHTLLLSIHEIFYYPLEHAIDYVYQLLEYGNDEENYYEKGILVKAFSSFFNNYSCFNEDVFDYTEYLVLSLHEAINDPPDFVLSIVSYFIVFFNVITTKHSEYINERWLCSAQIIYEVVKYFKCDYGTINIVNRIIDRIKKS